MEEGREIILETQHNGARKQVYLEKRGDFALLCVKARTGKRDPEKRSYKVLRTTLNCFTVFIHSFIHLMHLQWIGHHPRKMEFRLWNFGSNHFGIILLLNSSCPQWLCLPRKNTQQNKPKNAFMHIPSIFYLQFPDFHRHSETKSQILYRPINSRLRTPCSVNTY